MLLYALNAVLSMCISEFLMMLDVLFFIINVFWSSVIILSRAELTSLPSWKRGLGALVFVLYVFILSWLRELSFEAFTCCLGQSP